jgi:hypothetical protein
MVRPEPAPVIRPKLLDERLAFGSLKCTWSNALNNSHRFRVALHLTNHPRQAGGEFCFTREAPIAGFDRG